MKRAELPNHVGIIPDGNRRWARSKGKPDSLGHLEGVKRGKEILKYSREIGIHTMTMWGMSTENLTGRSELEIKILVEIFGELIGEYIDEAKKNGVKFIHLGRKDRLPRSLMEKIEMAEEETAENDKHVFNLALDYGGQDELVRAIEKIAKDVEGKSISRIEINENLISRYLDTSETPYPEPDLIIRTSGELRLSGFMPWQAVYAEYYFEPSFFPDFTKEKFDKAIEDYTRRKRRFGGQ